jgi:hypothetical protein
MIAEANVQRGLRHRTFVHSSKNSENPCRRSSREATKHDCRAPCRSLRLPILVGASSLLHSLHRVLRGCATPIPSSAAISDRSTRCTMQRIWQHDKKNSRSTKSDGRALLGTRWRPTLGPTRTPTRRHGSARTTRWLRKVGSDLISTGLGRR